MIIIELKVVGVFDVERVAGDVRDCIGLDVESWMKRNVDLFFGFFVQNSLKWMI